MVFDSKVPIGATPEYMAGHYMLQGRPPSCLSWLLHLSQVNVCIRVLDMAAAPGGKSTYISAVMKNHGLLVSNDANEKRIKSLAANLQRMGVRNAVVTCVDGRQAPSLGIAFDRVLLDAPCSGLGVISKDPSVRCALCASTMFTDMHLRACMSVFFVLCWVSKRVCAFVWGFGCTLVDFAHASCVSCLPILAACAL